METAAPGRASLAYEVALAVAVAVAFADSAIVVLALPELYAELETSISGLHWVITAYNAAVVVGAAALFPLLRRVRPGVLALLGIAVFLAASIACALAGDLGTLVGGRIAQGLGAALLLAASLPVLAALSGARDRAVAVWVAAGTLGTAVGPALGGVLTKAFDWRAIFIVQAPLAAAALPAALHPRVRAALPVLRERLRVPLGAALGLLLVSAALVGALFLAVLLVVTVWDYGPLAGAGMVSALPLAALAVRPLALRLPGPVDVAGGSLLLAAGLLALALLPASSPAYAVPALALAGAGLGLALSPFARAALPEHGELTGSAVFSVGVRHAGLVLGLVAVAPLLTAELEDAVDTATLNATAVILDARLPLQQKVPIALDLNREFQRAPEGEVPDLAGPFDERGADDDEAVRTARDDLRESVEAVLTRAFRSSFVLSAIFALLAAATAVAFHGRRRA
ncbi:MAG TPA: MFS transporter [Gaiellaceae bacterium]|nr:MFS transporter [Gaiellaceae bacterium]